MSAVDPNENAIAICVKSRVPLMYDKTVRISNEIINLAENTEKKI